MTVWVMNDLYNNVTRVFNNRDKAREEAEKIAREYADDMYYPEDVLEEFLETLEFDDYIEDVVIIEGVEVE